MATFGGQSGVGTSVETGEIEDGAVTNDKVNASAAIVLSKLATDPLARANHTGTQTKSTVSDYPVAASQAEMETGTEAAVREMSPLRVKQAVDANSASLVVRVLAGENATVELLGSGTTIEDNNGPVVRHADVSTTDSHWQCVVPKGAATLSSVKAFYHDESASALTINLKFHLFVRKPVAGGAFETDDTDPSESFNSGGTANRLVGITAAATCFNGITAALEGDVISMVITRDAADTYGAAWDIAYVEFTFA